MKRKIGKIVLIVVIVLAALIVIGACSGGDGSSTQPATTTQQTPVDESKGDLGDNQEYYVEINGAELSTYDGKSALKVSLKFTNNSQENAAFTTATIDRAFQNGVEIERGYHDSHYTQIQPGASIDVYSYYILTDATAPVDVEVEGLFVWSDTKVKKSFDLGAL